MIDLKVLQEVRETFGLKSQLDCATEELAELIVEVSKCKRDRCRLSQLAEEIADVRIVTTQLIQAYDILEEVDAWETKKINDLDKCIQKTKKGVPH